MKLSRKTFLKYKIKTLKKLEKKATRKIKEIQSLIYSLKKLELDTYYQLELINQALGQKKARSCKLYRPLNRKEARCLYWTDFPLPKKTLFQVYCSMCDKKNMEVKFLTDKLKGKV